MKTVLVLSTLFFAIALPALGALTDADLEKIRSIVTEEIQEELKPIKADIATLKTDVTTLKTDMAVMKTEVANLKETVNGKFNDVNRKFDDVQKNFDRQNNIIIACIGIPLAILAIGGTVWGISAHRRSEQDRALARQVETLTQEIEALKQQKIVSP